MKILISTTLVFLFIFWLHSSEQSQTLQLRRGSTNTFEGQLDESGQTFIEFNGKKGLPVQIKLVTKGKNVRFLLYAIHGRFQAPNRTAWVGRLPEEALWGVTITGRMNSIYKVIISAK